MEQLKGCDDVTKAFVLATMKDKGEGYTTRYYFQHQMFGGLQTIATDAVTTCPTYTKLLEVLNSDDLTNKSLRYFLPPTKNLNGNHVSWKANTKQHLLNTFESERETLCTTPNANLVYIMEAEYSKHIPDKILEYFTTPPISLFDKNPHNFSARLYWVKVGQVDIDDVVKTSISM